MCDETDTLNLIENDEFYKHFLKWTAKTGLAQSMTITEQVKKLGEGIDLLGKELHKQVLDKHDDLLRQASHATKLQNVLNTMNLHVQNLFANAERLKSQIHGPYNALETHTKVLSRLHLASHILRQVNRIQQLSKRLGNTNDPVKKATILQELEQLAADKELSDIDAVTFELRNIREQQQKVVKMATASLTQSIVNENTIQATTALQIFLNLGTIKSATQNLIDIALDECKESLKSSFDVTNGGSSAITKIKAGPGKATLSSSQGFRNRMWNDLEKAFSEEIYQQCKQVRFLQSTIKNMNMHLEDNVAEKFWKCLGDVITEEIKNSSTAVQQTLEEDYPKFLKCYYEMTQKLNYSTFVFSRIIFDKCENSYLTNSLNRLLEPTQAMFNQESIAPSHDQIDSLIRIIASELSVALVEDNLNEKIAKNVSKCIRLYGVKTEQQLATGLDASQVIGGAPNTGQQLNVQLANSVYYFQTQILRILSNMKDSLSSNSIDLVNESLTALDNLSSAIMEPLIGSIKATTETIVITIHLETDWSKLQAPTNRGSIPCSPYMRELIEFITRAYQLYLSSFDNKDILIPKCNNIAIRCIELLVRHSSILRPISQGGRLRLQSDYNYLEQALKYICPYLSDLGRPYRLLKSMATLITLTPSEIVATQLSGSSVPHSIVLLLLFSFAGSELASPHQNTGWSLQKLSTWFDEHPLESDRLDLIAGALQRYVTIVMQKNSVNYDPVYPIMSEFLENAVKNKF